MAFTSVHPHKGYLNTEFRLHSNHSKPLSYQVCRNVDSDNSITINSGIVCPNEPLSIKIQTPGEYVVCFEDGSAVNFLVEDGYKFGGGSYKSSFVDDSCPWLFIVMHDRTYFYNRITDESYVEAISPDYISFVSDDFVLLSNKGDDLQTLYSLKEQRPVICIKDIAYVDSQYVVWSKSNNEGHCLAFFSIENLESKIEVSCESFLVNHETKQIFYIYEKKLHRIDLSNNLGDTFLSDIEGIFINFVGQEWCISYDKRAKNALQIMNMSTCDVSSIDFEGTLAGVNGISLVDISKERESIYKLDLKESGFPNAVIEGKYVEFYIFPASWDIFYTIKTTSICKSLDGYRCDNEIFLKSLKSKVNQKLHLNVGKAITDKDRFCFYTTDESYVCGRIYSGSKYVEGGEIHTHKNVVQLSLDNFTYTLSTNGYWDRKMEVTYDYEYFGKYGIVKDKETGIYKSLSGVKYGKNISSGKDYIEFDDIRIYANGKHLSTKLRNVNLSPDHQYGIKISKDYKGKVAGDIILCALNNGEYEERIILQSLFDSSEYKNVLFSDNGNQVMYQSEKDAVVMDIATGKCEEFPSLSYIKHINGMRLFFETASSLQPRLVNPITKQYIDCNSMPDYQFVSPNGKLYADTRLQDYIEYYFIETGKLISKEEYDRLVDRFQYPYRVSKDHDSYIRVVEERKQFIRNHFEFLNNSYPHYFKNDPIGNKWNSIVLEENSSAFVRRVVGLRGIAVIRSSDTGSEVTRIPLGDPLSYINYVSFSYDSRYLALAGYRNFSHGLFLVYDLETKKTLYREQSPRAVWTTAFSVEGAVAGYSSEPITYLSYNPEYYDNIEKIDYRNFLTFSPDGNYFALSNQGYISKYDINGDERAVWGHQPSSTVYIRKILNNEDLYEFNDLADKGIAGVGENNSVASVSFSYDNSKLMMVGDDGVIVIRNLHLTEI